jgi:hypothetical protein
MPVRLKIEPETLYFEIPSRWISDLIRALQKGGPWRGQTGTSRIRRRGQLRWAEICAFDATARGKLTLTPRRSSFFIL